jgi:hypothetical protein
MVLDTSAIIATITNEQDSSQFRAAMLGAESLLISSVAVLETKIVLFARLGLDAVGPFEELLEKALMAGNGGLARTDASSDRMERVQRRTLVAMQQAAGRSTPTFVQTAGRRSIGRQTTYRR